MAKYRITTPVAGYTGVSVGATFVDGVAIVDAPDRDLQHPLTRALAYFHAQGYGVEAISPTPDGDEDQAPKAPKRSAAADVWRTYAVAQGMAAGEAATYSRDQLAERYLTTPKEGDQ